MSEFETMLCSEANLYLEQRIYLVHQIGAQMVRQHDSESLLPWAQQRCCTGEQGRIGKILYRNQS